MLSRCWKKPLTVLSPQENCCLNYPEQIVEKASCLGGGGRKEQPVLSSDHSENKGRLGQLSDQILGSHFTSHL